MEKEWAVNAYVTNIYESPGFTPGLQSLRAIGQETQKFLLVLGAESRLDCLPGFVACRVDVWECVTQLSSQRPYE